MLLHVPVPEGWTSTRTENGILHRKGLITLKAYPIREHPDDAALWLERTALQGAPVGTQWKQEVRTDLLTSEGWPALLYEVSLDHATLKQVRIIVFYKFLDYASAAVVRADPEELAREKGTVLDVLQRARPDWGPQDTVSLPSLFDGVTL